MQIPIGIKTDSVVTDAQTEQSILTLDKHRSLGGAGVPRGVRQGFLRDAKTCRFDVVRDSADLRSNRDRRDNPAARGITFSVPAYCARQTQIVQQRRPQL